MFEFSAYLLII